MSVSPLHVIESNFLRLVKLFHAHKDAGERQLMTIEARLVSIETALKGLLDNAPKEK